MRLAFFVVAVVVMNGAYLAWAVVDARRRRASLHRRLSVEAPRSKAKPKAALLQGEDGAAKRSVLDRAIEALRLTGPLEALLERAGERGGAHRFVRRMAVWAAGGGAAGAMLLPFDPLLAGPAAALAGAALPLTNLHRTADKRLLRFEEQFPSCLEFIARSMRAGHGLSVALELMPGEFEEPIAGEFKRAWEEHSLGMTLDGALRKLAARLGLPSVHFFACAVTLQRRTGGNLAEVLEKLAGIIRERFKLEARIRVISAHGRLTATALTLIPVCVAGLMWVVNRSYVRFFVDDPSGKWLASGAVFMQAVGYLVIRKMVKIEV